MGDYQGKDDSGYFSEMFKIRYYDIDLSGHLLLPVLFRFLQQTAGEHHTAVSDSLLDLVSKGLGWFLLQAVVEVERMPQYGERIEIRTWLSEIGTIRAQREYEIYDEQGNLIAKAQKLWAFFDLNRRRPAPIPSQIRNQWTVVGRKAIESLECEELELKRTDHQADIYVRFTDLDVNGHVNNLRYIEWLQEVYPDNPNLMVKRLMIKFMSESKRGEHLQVRGQVEPRQSGQLRLLVGIDNLNSGKRAVIASMMLTARQ